MDSIFISSIQRNFAEVRRAAARAIEAYGFHPVTAETTGASAESAQRALLDEVQDAGIFLLILGPVYGERGESGFSPTEDEFREALRVGKPILVIKQNTEFEPDQEDFLTRVRGSWEQGRLTGSFDSEADVGHAVVRALRTLEGSSRPASSDEKASARERVAMLAQGPDTSGYVSSESKARIAVSPMRSHAVLTAVDLEDPSLIDSILGIARSTGIVRNEMAISTNVTAEGIRFVAKADGSWEELHFFVGSDGSVVSEGAVGGDALHFGSNVVMAGALSDLIEKSQAFVLAVWEAIDKSHDIREAAAMVAIPDAQHKVFSEVELGNSMSMPSSSPNVIAAPEPPYECRREDIGSVNLSRTLLAEVRRKFADLGAIHE